ncbi:MAG TPA: PrgI family protein [Candidatus Paceibacterota bacterium]|nr:PrgI family protein [Candidatus Paceibacterota bacterium]HPQ22948.1 PrgI family protein [Candidatus Paceibacterota bacterium]
MPVPVPQFIKEETKIMGILTFAQLTIICVGGGIIIGLFFVLEPTFWVIIAVIGLPLTLLLAFGQIEGMPMYQIFPYLLRHLWVPKEYLWSKEKTVFQKEAITPKKITPEEKPEIKKEITEEAIEKIAQYLDQNNG